MVANLQNGNVSIAGRVCLRSEITDLAVIFLSSLLPRINP